MTDNRSRMISFASRSGLPAFLGTLLVLFCLLCAVESNAQFNPNCTGGVPTYNVDFTGNSQGVFEILNEIRAGNCCGTVSPDRCLRINITPDTGAVAVLFEVTAGSLSPGALFYQINCGTPTVVGQAACVSGASVLTFCKPGNNTNSYRLTSIPRATFPQDDTVRQNCSDTVQLLGLRPDSVRITSVFPGVRGQYDSYLSCTSGCDQFIITAGTNAPQYVDYEVCGYPIADQCSFTSTQCRTFRIYIRPQLNLTVTPNPASFCPTSPTVTLTASASGGVPPYDYLWYNGSTVVSTTNSYSASAVGTYTLEVNDALGSGCPSSTLSVPVSFQNLVTSIASTNVSCNGADNGIALALPTGGSFPYTYLWSNNETTATVNGLAPGSYSVTITDFTGCTTASTVSITEPATLSLSLVAVTDVGCNGESTGAADMDITGGTPPFTYLWSNGATTQDLSGVPAGLYTLVATDSNGCTAQYQQRIDEPTTLDPLISGTSFNVTNVSCYGGSDGQVAILVQGGIPPYTYLWSNGSSDSVVTGLPAGPLEVSIVDSNGCSALANVTLTEPDSLSLSLLSLSTYNGLYNVSCNGSTDGSLDIQVQGGTPPYSFSWSNGEVTEDLNNIPAGTYDLTVTDTLGCTAQLSVTLIEPDPLSLSLNSPVFGNGYNIACKGENSGRIFSTVTGGTSPYNYTWNPGGATTDSLTDLYAGFYLLDLVDANGCITYDTITLTEPDTLVPLISSTTIGFTNIACYGYSNGTATVSVVGGTPPFTYTWSNGDDSMTADSLSAGPVSVFVVDFNGCTGDTLSILTEPNQLLAGLSVSNDALCYGTSTGNAVSNANGGTSPYTYFWSNGNTTSALSNVPAGSYAVLILDANGCQTTDSVTVLQPDLLAVTAVPATFPSGNNISCAGANDGSIDLTVTGGTQNYSYSWSNSATSEDLNGLAPGNYSVTVTDANGCTNQQSITLTEPTPLITDSIFSLQYAGGVNVSCNGGTDGQIEVVASGGSAPYSYSWTNGGTTAVISGVSVDTFVVTVTDANGCTALAAIRITEPSLLNSSVSTQQDADCYGNATGTVTIGASGSTAPYEYYLDNDSLNLQSSATFNGLLAGPHNITVVDANGCTIIQGVTIGQPAATLSANASAVGEAGCNGYSSGSIDVAASGGTSPYQYSLDSAIFQQTSLFNGLDAGSYTVFVLDANNCTTNFDVTVSQPAAIDIAGANSGSIAAACASTNGVAFVVPAGGTPPYTYSWTGPVTGTRDTLRSAPPGNYVVTVVDANGCDTVQSITVSEVDCDFGLPTGFSPNGDGKNDDFEVRGADKYPDNILKVFNRWGNEVYSKEDYTGHEWFGQNNNGDPLPEGTYFVVFSANDSDFRANTYVDIRR